MSDRNLGMISMEKKKRRDNEMFYQTTYTLSQETNHILQNYPKQQSKILENSAHHQYQYKHKDGNLNHVHVYTYISKERSPSTEAEGLIDFLKTAGGRDRFSKLKPTDNCRP